MSHILNVKKRTGESKNLYTTTESCILKQLSNQIYKQCSAIYGINILLMKVWDWATLQPGPDYTLR